MLITLVTHEIKYYFKNKTEVFNIYSIFIITSLLHIFSKHAEELKDQQLAPQMLWTALALAMTVSVHNLFQRDHENGVLEHYQSSRGSLSTLILAKWIAYYFSITIPLLAFLPVIALLVDIPVDALPRFCLGLGLGSMALSLVASLMSAAMTGLEKAGALVALAVMPLYIPIIIFGVSYLNSTGGLWQPQLLFLGGLSLILLPILCVAGASCIRASN